MGPLSSLSVHCAEIIRKIKDTLTTKYSLPSTLTDSNRCNFIPVKHAFPVNMINQYVSQLELDFIGGSQIVTLVVAFAFLL